MLVCDDQAWPRVRAKTLVDQSE